MYKELILDVSHISALIVEERGRKDIVVGAPHHAPLGTPELPCNTHKDADENTGILTDYLAQLLDCHSIVASNYFLDSNKAEETDYFKKISEWSPKILLEIHGHGGANANFDIEISSGSKEATMWAIRLADKIRERILNTFLDRYTISGEYEKIYFKATKSKTITYDKWIAFHIELPKDLRASVSQYQLFCELSAEAINELLDSLNE